MVCLDLSHRATANKKNLRSEKLDYLSEEKLIVLPKFNFSAVFPDEENTFGCQNT